MKRYFLHTNYCVLLFVLLYISCLSTSRISNQNLAFIYRKENLFPVNPKLQVFHNTKDSSRVFFQVDLNELVYKKNDDASTAKFRINFKLFDSYESKIIVDSATLFYKNLLTENGTNNLIYHFDIFTPLPKIYVLEVEWYDLSRKLNSRDFVIVNKTGINNYQNFLVYSVPDKKQLFRNYVHSGEEITVTPAQKNITKLFVKYYSRDFDLAFPPFFNNIKKPFDYIPDSLYVFDTEKPFTINQKGLYHFQADTSVYEGLTIYNFYDEFPAVEKVERLIHPLRYLTSKKEFEEINRFENKKLMVDQFWLDVSGNDKDRAKKLIRSYYKRVYNANIYFTSFKEGWKTDRGLIYTIYGYPNSIYKNSFSETWIYGEPTSMLSITFNFIKVDNPFSDNDYELSRQLIYQNSWYLAVDQWRQGFVFNPE